MFASTDDVEWKDAQAFAAPPLTQLLQHMAIASADPAPEMSTLRPQSSWKSTGAGRRVKVNTMTFKCHGVAVAHTPAPSSDSNESQFSVGPIASGCRNAPGEIGEVGMRKSPISPLVEIRH
ncbi:hypothetical protein VTN31DRAFT_1668 [Thermomyces dupontii]|uniref:uncharacterized protein n=1 Tax=Talaromyces thermophilus TaxID=28565 RepID=UPI00374261C6